jgi:hypothetical protein
MNVAGRDGIERRIGGMVREQGERKEDRAGEDQQADQLIEAAAAGGREDQTDRFPWDTSGNLRQSRRDEPNPQSRIIISNGAVGRGRKTRGESRGAMGGGR